MEPFTTLASAVVRIDGRNVDTDQIIPARFLRNPRKGGYGGYLFHDLRFAPDGSPIDGFALNRPESQGARILVAGDNFGCGSSREGAVYALLDYGIRCVIAPGFGDIFRNNCCKNAILPLAMPQDEIERLLAGAGPTTPVTVDLPAQTVTCGSETATFAIEPFWKTCLVNGADDIDITLGYRAAIDAFAAGHFARHPWMALPARRTGATSD